MEKNVKQKKNLRVEYDNFLKTRRNEKLQKT